MRRSRWLVALAMAGCLIGGATATTAAAAPSADGCASARGAVVPSAADAASNGMLAEALRRHATWLTTLSCTATGIRHSGVTNNLLSDNWSGYQVTQHANYAQGGWTVPTV